MKSLLRYHKSSSRALALTVIHTILTKKLHLQHVLHNALMTNSCPVHDTPLITELVYGYLRYHIRIQALIHEKLHKRGSLPYPLLLTLGIALYELLYMSSTSHSSIVFHTVDCIKQRYSASLAKVSNAILRSILREKDTVCSISYSFSHAKNQSEQYALQYSLPLYIWELLEQQYKEKAHSYALHFLERPFQYSTTENPSTLELFTRLDITKYYDDTSIVWECCTGVGGKKRILEEHHNAPIIASDISYKKLIQHPEKTHLLCADATLPPFKDNSLTMIVADVPCSGLGTLRKRPDIKLHRQPCDIINIQSIQYAILHAIAPLVQKGGCIVYITCSIVTDENEQQIQKFLSQYPNFLLEKEYILEPSSHINDIFYGALLYRAE